MNASSVLSRASATQPMHIPKKAAAAHATYESTLCTLEMCPLDWPKGHGEGSKQAQPSVQQVQALAVHMAEVPLAGAYTRKKQLLMLVAARPSRSC